MGPKVKVIFFSLCFLSAMFFTLGFLETGFYGIVSGRPGKPILSKKVAADLFNRSLRANNLPKKVSSTSAKKMLVIVPSVNLTSEFYLHIVNSLDGLGFQYDLINDNQILATDLLEYSQIVCAGHSAGLLNIDSQEGRAIETALRNGRDILWINNGIWSFPNLADNFGISYISHQSASSHNIGLVEWLDTSQSLVKTKIYSEYVVKTQLSGATAEGYFRSVSNGRLFPAITSYKKGNYGRAVFVGFDLFAYWKSENNAMTWSRAEMFIKYLRKTQATGQVNIHPYPNGKSAVFIVRFEDITPAGSMMEQNDPVWVARFDNIVEYLRARQIPANLAIVPIYAYPYADEYHFWDETEWNGNLRAVVEKVLDYDGALIAHGYTHQSGSGRDDFSGDDNEMYDEDTGRWLSFTEQLEKTIGAKEELRRQFGLNVLTWETPHYLANLDTYRAVEEAGFKFVSESDTKLFPNIYGYENLLRQRLLMLPETAYNIPDYPGPDFTDNYLTGVLPRMERIGGNFTIFYHNNTDRMADAIKEIANAAFIRDFWFPNVEEYGEYTEKIRNISLTQEVTDRGIIAHLSYAGNINQLTVNFRLPDGRNSLAAQVNGQRVDYLQKSIDNLNFALVSFDLNHTATIEVLWDLSEENQPPSFSQLPDYQLIENEVLDRVVDLWQYVADESDHQDLIFTISACSNEQVGARIDNNRYLSLEPEKGWYGEAQVTIRVTDPGGLFAESTFQIVVLESNGVPAITGVRDLTLVEGEENQKTISIVNVDSTNVLIGLENLPHFCTEERILSPTKIDILLSCRPGYRDAGVDITKENLLKTYPEVVIYASDSEFEIESSFQIDLINRSIFSDLEKDHWAFWQIEALYNSSVINGFADQTYQPEEIVNRAQMSVYLARVIAGGDDRVPEGPENPSFFDVEKDFWAYKYIEFILTGQIAFGYEDGSYRPELAVNRESMAVFIARAIAQGDDNIPPGPLTPTFADIELDHWAYRHVEYLAQLEVVLGYSDGLYHGQLLVDRAQMAVYIYRAFFED